MNNLKYTNSDSKQLQKDIRIDRLVIFITYVATMSVFAYIVTLFSA